MDDSAQQRIEAKREEAKRRKAQSHQQQQQQQQQQQLQQGPAPTSVASSRPVAASPSVTSLYGSEPEGAPKPKPKSVGYFRDTQAGFLIEEEAGPKQQQKGEDDQGEQSRKKSKQLVSEPGPEYLPSYPNAPTCADCGGEFTSSFLQKNFGLPVCNVCRETHRHGKYGLVTKTTAKQDYLLRESELSTMDGGLRCVERENPNSKSYSKMKLYLRSQVEETAFKHYGSLQGLEEEHERRELDQRMKKQKRHERKMTKMRNQTMASEWLKSQKPHEHDFPKDKEVYDEENDEYIKTCSICGFSVRFEKL